LLVKSSAKVLLQVEKPLQIAQLHLPQGQQCSPRVISHHGPHPRFKTTSQDVLDQR
jgi:hypothetical protein